MVAEQILAKWHKDIDEAVSEGETYNEYANILVPQAKTDAEKIALKLVELRKIEFDKLPKNTSIGLQERRGEDISRKIVYSTQVTKPIEVIAYHNADNAADSQSTTDSSTTSESIPGTAVKTGQQTWTVYLENEEPISLTSDDLLDSSRFFVKRECWSNDVNANERKKQSAKRKRARMSERIQKEKQIHDKAKEELREFERRECENMLTFFKSGKEYHFEDFLEMVDRIRKPFVCFVEGHEVAIMQDDSAMMMEQSVMKEITDSLFHGEKRARSDDKNEQIRKKQRRGYQAVNTEKGATAITALHQTTKRDDCQNQLALKKINGLNHEIKQVETVLTGLVA